MVTERERILDVLAEMKQYFSRCVNNCTLGSVAYRRFSGYVWALDKVEKIVKEDKNDYCVASGMDNPAERVGRRDADRAGVREEGRR